jgi:uncharacterized lipoprotein YmbA
MRVILFLAVISMFGCASQPERTYQPADMNNFVASCSQAKRQVDFLSQRINEYLEYHRTYPPTLEDRRYYEKLKNTIWSLRSSCSALQR